MIDERTRNEVFAIAEEFSHLESFAASSNEVGAGSHRLEGAFYGDAGYRAKQLLLRAGFSFVDLNELATVYWPGRSYSYEEMRRTYVDKEIGIPLLSTSEMMLARLDTDSNVSRVQKVSLDMLLVQPGSLLVSGSGTIGNTVVVSEDFDGKYVSHHAMRILPLIHESLGTLTAYCQSQCGQFLITRNKSGGVIDTIYEDDLRWLPVPVLPRSLRIELTRLIDQSCALRVRANRLLDEAQEQVQRSCYLPPLKSFVKAPYCESEGNAELFVTSSKARLSGAHGFGEVRLDATYHEPVALAIAKYIRNSKGGTTLGTLLQGVRNSSLRKRIYVDDPAQGVPLIGGKQLIQWRPMGVNYLSRTLTRNLESEKALKGWTIVSCGGTLGRCQFVHRNFEGWAMSQDVMRIMPDTSRVYPGFVYAFLDSPYGQAQIMQRGYGSVIPRLREFQFGSIAIRLPDDKGEAIDSTVMTAFDFRADARAAEDRAISLFEEALRRGRAYIEAEWGTEY